ncbi:MAG TPA: LytTR family DNA-binding domain-containing protein [Cyclobacteriaceae bacterium]|jgi:DNA-binding LytR/AlgR family response regulator|nr:LytTR family DNA-binding domain-containing protein [Cyclobacteriaceae bacterium]
MKIVIIEDEKLTANDLAETICRLYPETEIVAMLHSVKEGVNFFQQGKNIDLIFSDIQLGDGLSFEIFSQATVHAPIIFCTAYDEYALNAFRTNGIDYILKPFTDDTVSASLNKFMALKKNLAPSVMHYEEIVKLFNVRRPSEAGSVLVHHKDKIIPIAISSIAFFQLKNAVVHLTTFENKTYFLNKNLEDMEKSTGSSFFRVNRQFLINRKAVVDASSYLARKISVKLSVPVSEIITVSKEKVSTFLSWLEQP